MNTSIAHIAIRSVAEWLKSHDWNEWWLLYFTLSHDCKGFRKNCRTLYCVVWVCVCVCVSVCVCQCVCVSVCDLLLSADCSRLVSSKLKIKRRCCSSSTRKWLRSTLNWLDQVNLLSGNMLHVASVRNNSVCCTFGCWEAQSVLLTWGLHAGYCTQYIEWRIWHSF